MSSETFKSRIEDIETNLERATLILTDTFKKGSDVFFFDLAKLPIHEKFIIETEKGNIVSMLIYRTDSLLVLRTKFPPSAKLNLHQHPDCEETFCISKGEVLETITMQTRKSGEFFHAFQNDSHRYVASKKGAEGTIIVKKICN